MLRQVLSPMWLGRGTPIRSNVERWAWRLRWIAIAWIVVFWRLGYLSLLDPDEAHYAELTREMVQGGNWLVPLLDGQPLIDKPVIFHWLQGLSVALLGESEFAVRLPSALAALVLFVLTRWVGVLMFGAAVGEWAAIMLATIPATFALSSVGLFDMVFTMFLFGAVACLIVAMLQPSRQIEYSGYALLTLAVMTKGPVALLLVLLFFGVTRLLGSEARTRLATLHWVRGLVCVAIAASPWYVWMYVRFGAKFVEGSSWQAHSGASTCSASTSGCRRSQYRSPSRSAWRAWHCWLPAPPTLGECPVRRSFRPLRYSDCGLAWFSSVSRRSSRRVPWRRSRGTWPPTRREMRP